MTHATRGWLNGLIGVVLFAGSLPATRLAVRDLDPWFVTSARAAIAGLISLAALGLLRQTRPARPDWVALAVVSLGVVVGFPLLTALALREVSSAHATTFIGLLPLSTALFGVWRTGARPRPAFWLFAVLGAAAILAFAVLQGGRSSIKGDLLMIGAVIVCGLGYAEGAQLTRRLGGWQVISWALVLALPGALVAALLLRPIDITGVSAMSLAGLAYVSVVSMWLGFIFWYRGLAIGGVAEVGQLQLIQPFLSFALAALLLGEQVTAGMLVTAVIVIACVGGARRTA